jgi:hypothetical protein
MKTKILLPLVAVIAALGIVFAASAFSSKETAIEKNTPATEIKRPASAMFYSYNPALPQSSRTSYTRVDNPGEDPCPGSDVLCGIWVLPSASDSHPDLTAFNALKANPSYYNSTTQQFIENPGVVEFKEE